MAHHHHHSSYRGVDGMLSHIEAKLTEAFVMDSALVGDFLRQASVTSTVHSFVRGRSEDPRTLLFFQVAAADSDDSDGGNGNGGDDGNSHDGGSSSKDSSSGGGGSKQAQQQQAQQQRTAAAAKAAKAAAIAEGRNKLVFTTGATDGLRGLCLYFLALPVVGKPDPNMGFLGSYRVVSGSFDARSGPSLLSDMGDLIGIVFRPIHFLRESSSSSNVSSAGLLTDEVLSSSSSSSLTLSGGGGGVESWRGDGPDSASSHLGMDGAIAEFSHLMQQTAATMGRVGQTSRLAHTVHAADLSTTTPDRLLRRLNRQLALMLSPSALELPTSLDGQFLFLPNLLIPPTTVLLCILSRICAMCAQVAHKNLLTRPDCVSAFFGQFNSKQAPAMRRPI